MAEIKIVIGDPKTGKSHQVVVEAEKSKALMGLKIGDTIKGDVIEFQGYEFRITGGSDNAGFPMRKDVEGASRKRILAVSGVGLKKKGKGVRQRKTVAGNTITQNTAQINVVVVKHGKKPIGASDEKAPEGEKAGKEAKESKETQEPEKAESEKKKSAKEEPEETKKAEGKEEAKQAPEKPEKK